MDCPTCGERLALELAPEDPARGSLAPSQRVTLTCEECGFVESDLVVPGIDGSGIDAWVHARDSFHREMQAFTEGWVRELDDGARDRLVDEHARVTGYLQLVGTGEVPETLTDIELWAAKKRALETLLGR